LKTLIVTLALFASQIAFSQSADEKIIQQVTSNLASESRADKMIEIGKKFLGKPYIANTLESPKEKLICRLDGFDCYTFVETVLALVLTSESVTTDYETFAEEVQYLRYREGEINGYASRIHYFFEWAKLAEKNGVLTDLTPELGTKSPKNINFMSTHRQFYPAFTTNDQVLAEIKTMEKNVNKYAFYEIKTANLPEVQSEIKNGDILAFASNVAGLDVNHEGLAYWKGNKLHFIHASSAEKKVVISDQTIQDYLNSIKKDTGLMVLRLVEDNDL
jgi:cell wall-associated NlpC family hydrolase